MNGKRVCRLAVLRTQSPDGAGSHDNAQGVPSYRFVSRLEAALTILLAEPAVSALLRRSTTLQSRSSCLQASGVLTVALLLACLPQALGRASAPAVEEAVEEILAGLECARASSLPYPFGFLFPGVKSSCPPAGKISQTVFLGVTSHGRALNH